MAEVQLSGCRLRVATYNVHDCVGRDGVYAPDRIAAIVADLRADLVALQEITLDHAGDVVALLERTTAMHAIDGTLFERGVGAPSEAWRFLPGASPGRERDREDFS